MGRKAPPPVCKAFLVCHKIEGETLALIGQENCVVNRQFPGSTPLSFFARLSG